MTTILMIEDDGNFVRLVEKILEPHGFQILHASTALSGMQLVENTPVDLILLDMDLPDLDGKVVATMLRNRLSAATTPIIAVTAHSDTIARRLALGFGCDGFIPKPIDTRTFPTQVKDYLKGLG